MQSPVLLTHVERGHLHNSVKGSLNCRGRQQAAIFIFLGANFSTIESQEQVVPVKMNPGKQPLHYETELLLVQTEQNCSIWLPKQLAKSTKKLITLLPEAMKRPCLTASQDMIQLLGESGVISISWELLSIHNLESSLQNRANCRLEFVICA